MCAQIIDLYPSEEEIVAKDDDLKCDHCEKRFANSSARRMHLVKTHRIIECVEDRRLYDRSANGVVRTFICHCPVEGCLRRDVKFEGMRNLKQHYIRVHTIKTLLCECGGKFALQKDLFYHRKTRCTMKTQNISKEIHLKPKIESKKKRIRRVDNLMGEAQKKEVQLLERTDHLINGQRMAQPIILVVPTENVTTTIKAIKRTLSSTNEIAVQVHPYDITTLTETNTVAVGMDTPQSFDFSGQFNSAGPSVQHASTYYYPPNQTEVESLAVGVKPSIMEFTQQEQSYCYQNNQQQQYAYDYGNELLQDQIIRTRTTNMAMQFEEQTTSGSARSGQFLGNTPVQATDEVVSVPLTRNFGTIVEESLFSSNNTPMRNAETSMTESEFDLLRDTETQTPWNDVGLMTDYWPKIVNSP